MTVDVTSQVDVSALAAGQPRTAASARNPILNLVTVINNALNGIQVGEKIRFDELAGDPTAPTAASGEWIVYAKSGGIYVIDDTGAVTGPFGAGGAGGAPTDATYITQTANGTLSNEQALSTLQTGAVQVTTTTGVLTSLKSNTTTTAPGVTNDVDENYSVGSIWYDTTADKAYVCMDNSDGAAVWLEITAQAGSASLSYARMWDEKANNTAGGSSVATTWTNRVLNTESDPDSLVSIAANLFTPIAGTYHIHAEAPFIGNSSALSKVRLRLYNNTGGAAVAGTLGPNHAIVASGTALATLDGYFTANGTDAYALQYYVTSARTTDGLGLAMNEGGGTVEIYSVVTLEKIG